MLSQGMARRSPWIWLVPAGLVAAGWAAGSDPPVAAGMGLAAGLSLSGSI